MFENLPPASHTFPLNPKSVSAKRAKRLIGGSSAFAQTVHVVMLLIAMAAVSELWAATTLAIGDISIASANSDAPDGFTFVLLKDVDSSTVIKFTDDSFKSNGSATAASNIRGSENFVVWTSGATLSAGTVIRMVNTSGSITTVTGGGSATGALSGLSASGDQIFIYQGTGTGSNVSGTSATETFSGTILYGANLANSGWLTTGSDSTNNSYRPSELAGIDANIALGASADYGYTAARTGLTTAVYRAALANTDNWTGYAANQTQSTTAFTIGTLANLTWDGNGKTSGTGGTGTWDTTTQSRFSNSGNDTFVHWVNSVSGSEQTAVFGGTAGAVTVSGGVTTSGLTFSVTGYTIQSDTITLAGATPTISVTTSGHTAAVSSVLAGDTSLSKGGAGTLTLSGTNTYTGATAVSTGVLNIQNATGLGTVAAGTSVTSGAALEIQGGVSVGAEDLTLNGTGVSAAGALRNISGTNTYGGLLTLGSAARINSDAGSLSLSHTGTITGSGFGLTVGGAANTSIAGIIGTGAGTLTKDGAGTVTLTGANTYTGVTTISTGILALSGSGSINNSPTITVASGTTFSVGSVSGGYSLASGQTLKGTGTVSGAMTVTSGSTLSPGNSPGTLLQTGNQTWNGGGNYNWQISNATGAAGSEWDLVNITGSLTIAANSGNKFNLNLWSLSGVGPDVNGDTANFNNANNYAWKITAASAGISGFAADAFNINTSANNGTAGFSNALNGGTFSVSLSGNDLNLVFTAATGNNLYWNGGTWTTSSPGTGGNGTWQDGSGSWDSAKTANFGGTAGTVSVGGAGAMANKGIIFLADGYSLSGGTITLSSTPEDSVITVGSAMTATVSSAFSTAAGITKSGAGTLILTNPHSFTGGTTVSAGTLTLGHATNTLPDAGAVTVSGGTLDTSTNTDTVGSFTITSGTLGGSGTLTAATYALNGGTITGNLGSGAATSSSGSTALNGTLAADLTVSGGTVNLGSADRLGNASTVSLSSGTLGMSTFSDTVGTFALSGTGTLGGSTGILTATSYALQGGTVNAKLGAGAVTVTTGTTTLGSAARLDATSTVAVNSGQLALGGDETVFSYTQSGGTLGGSGTLTASTYSLGGGTVTANLGTGAATASSGTTALDGTLAADLTVSGGTVNLGSADRLGNASAVSISSGTLGISTFNDTVGTLGLSGTGTLGGSTGILTATSYALQGGTVIAKLGAGAVTVSTGTTTLGSAARLGATSTVAVNSGQLALGGDETVSSYTQSGGTLGGSGTLTASTYALNGGTVTANLGTGTATAASGSTALNGTLGGSLTVSGGTVTLGAADRIANTGAVAVSSGALNLGGNSDTVGAVSTTGGTISNGTLNGSSYALNGGDVSAVLSGTGALTATTGTTTLSGNSSGFSGNTTVNGGSLALGSSGALGTSAVTMSGGSVLGGTGTTNSNAITIGTAASTQNNPFTVVFNFGTGSGDAAASSSNATGFTVGSVTQGNNNGITTLLGNTSPSSNSGASGQFNAGANSINGAFNSGTSTYFEVTLTRTTATSVSLNDVSFGSRSTGTGPTAYSIRSTADLTTSLASGTFTANSTWAGFAPTFTDTAIDSGGTTLRLYGYSGTGAAGGSANWRIDDLTLTGTSTTNVTASGSGTLGIAEAGSTTFSGAITVNNTATLDAVSGGTANFTNVITGVGSITKTSAGSVVLSGNNTYTGATTISAGTLQVGNGGTTGSLGSTSGVTNAAALVFNRSNALTVSPVISGTGSVTQAGTGTTSLSNDNTYTGTTTITAGVLRLDSASALSGGIGSSGGTSGLTLNGGVLGLGVGDFTRALGTGAAQVQFTGSGGFAAYGADRTVNFGGAGDTVTWNSGSFVPNGSSLILGAADSDKKITLQNAIDFGGSIRTIQVIKGTATGADVFDAKLAGALSNGSYTQTGDGRLEVAGAITGTTFDQSATNGTLALTSTLTTTGAFTQSGTGSTTTVSGSGSISAGSFTQSGTGSATTVTGTGSIVSTSAANLTAGTVTLNAAAADTAFVAPTINIGGAALVLGASNQIANTASVVLTSGSVGWSGSGHSETIETFTNSGGTFVTGANTLIGTGATVTWSGGTNTVSNGGNVQDAHLVISGGTNTVEGGATGGVLQLNTGGDGLEMSNGSTLTLNSDNAVAGKLLLKGNVSTTGDSTVTIASGLANTNKGNIDLDSGTRTFTVANGAAANDLLVSSVILNGAVTKEGAGKMTVTAANTYAGTTTVSDGTLQLGDGGTTGSISSSSDIALSSSTATLAVNRSDSISLNQAITGSGKLEITSGSAVLGSASNSYSGTTTVNGGSLQVGSSGTGKSGTGATTVASGSTILGSGVVQASSLTAASGSTIQVGDDTAATTFATLSFTPVTGGGTHNLQASIILGIGTANNLGSIDGLFDGNAIGSAGYITFVQGYSTGTGTGNHDLLSFNNAAGGGGHTLNFLTSSGTLQIVDGGLTGQKGQIFNLLDWGNLVTANFSGFDVGANYRSGGLDGDLDLPTLGAGLVWDVSQFTTNGALVVVPEPSRMLFVLLGGVMLMFRRRRING